MTQLAIIVLGGLEIRLARANTPLELPTRKSKALLAYLALSPGMTRSREHLAGALRGRSAEEQARASLRQTLSSLRKVLSSTRTSVVNTDTHAIWLDSQAIEVDAVRFEQLAMERSLESLEQAVAIYQGDLLGGFSLREESGASLLRPAESLRTERPLRSRHICRRPAACDGSFAGVGPLRADAAVLENRAQRGGA